MANLIWLCSANKMSHRKSLNIRNALRELSLLKDRQMFSQYNYTSVWYFIIADTKYNLCYSTLHGSGTPGRCV